MTGKKKASGKRKEKTGETYVPMARHIAVNFSLQRKKGTSFGNKVSGNDEHGHGVKIRPILESVKKWVPGVNVRRVARRKYQRKIGWCFLTDSGL